MREEQLRLQVKQDPGDPAFADLVALLIGKGELQEAMMVGLAGLSNNPNCHKGRLFLAHAFFRAGFLSFAAREVAELLRDFPERPQLKILLEKLQPGDVLAAQAQDSRTADGSEQEVADVEFDLDLVDELDK